jgi:hypothetical protein
MIRQAHTYLAGAVSGTALVAAAVVAFVMLVSFQALHDWPLTDLNFGGGDNAASAPNRSGGGTGAASAQATPAAGAAGAAAATTAARNGAGVDRSPAGSGSNAAVDASPATASPAPASESPGSSPTDQAPGNTSNPGGSASSSPAGGNNNGGGGGGGGASNPGTSGSPSTSEAVTGTVNKTVSGVDQVTGGALGSTGVPKVTEETVNNVAGPESVVGKTVDETVKTVNETLGGLLGGKH